MITKITEFLLLTFFQFSPPQYMTTPFFSLHQLTLGIAVVKMAGCLLIYIQPPLHLVVAMWLKFRPRKCKQRCEILSDQVLKDRNVPSVPPALVPSWGLTCRCVHTCWSSHLGLQARCLILRMTEHKTQWVRLPSNHGSIKPALNHYPDFYLKEK